MCIRDRVNVVTCGRNENRNCRVSKETNSWTCVHISAKCGNFCMKLCHIHIYTWSYSFVKMFGTDNIMQLQPRQPVSQRSERCLSRYYYSVCESEKSRLVAQLKTDRVTVDARSDHPLTAMQPVKCLVKFATALLTCSCCSCSQIVCVTTFLKLGRTKCECAETETHRSACCLDFVAWARYCHDMT